MVDFGIFANFLSSNRPSLDIFLKNWGLLKENKVDKPNNFAAGLCSSLRLDYFVSIIMVVDFVLLIILIISSGRNAPN